MSEGFPLPALTELISGCGYVYVCLSNKYVFIFLLVTFPQDHMFIEGRDCVVSSEPLSSASSCVEGEGGTKSDLFL